MIIYGTAQKQQGIYIYLLTVMQLQDIFIKTIFVRFDQTDGHAKVVQFLRSGKVQMVRTEVHCHDHSIALLSIIHAVHHPLLVRMRMKHLLLLMMLIRILRTIIVEDVYNVTERMPYSSPTC